MTKRQRREERRRRAEAALPPRKQQPKPEIQKGASTDQLNVGDLITRAEYAALETAVSKVAANQEKKQGRKKTTLFIAWIALIVSIGSAAGSIWQGAGTARSVDAQVANFQQGSRAYVLVSAAEFEEPPTVGHPVKVIVQFKNFGTTPAVSVKNSFAFDFGGPSTWTPDRLTPKASTTVMGGSEAREVHIVSEASLTPDVVEAIKAGRTEFYVHGRIWYDDVFGVAHETEGCVYYDARRDVMSSCPDHNGFKR